MRIDPRWLLALACALALQGAVPDEDTAPAPGDALLGDCIVDESPQARVHPAVCLEPAQPRPRPWEFPSGFRLRAG